MRSPIATLLHFDRGLNQEIREIHEERTWNITLDILIYIFLTHELERNNIEKSRGLSRLKNSNQSHIQGEKKISNLACLIIFILNHT